MASGIRLTRTDAADILTPPADKVTVFMDDATGLLSQKDEAGVVADFTGPTGSTGATGAPGSVWYEGAGAPGGGLGINGDYYLNTTNDDVYLKAGGSWGVVGNIKGSTGATGSTGSTGSAGANGAVWYTGSGAPSGGTGINGDFYLDGINGDVYTKSGGSWSVTGNIKGTTGATGPAGTTLNPSAFIYAYNNFR